MNLIQAEENTLHLLNGRNGWGSISINREWVAIVEVDSGQLGCGQRNGGVTTTAKRADYARSVIIWWRLSR